MATSISPATARWLGDHHGVATTAELRQLGLGRKAVERLCVMGVLRRVTRGVFVLTSVRPTLAHRCRTLCCMHPGGFVTGPTAAMLEGLRRQPAAAALHFSVRHGVHLEAVEGVRFRQTTQLRADDRRIRPDGIVVASWKRLAFDLAADLLPLDHRSVVHQLLDRRCLVADELLAVGERLCHPARRGTTTFRLSLLELGQGSHDSHPEVLLGDALLRRGIPVEPQLAVERADGIAVHLDLGVAGAKWGVEVDVHPEHRSVDGHRRDARRIRSLHDGAWQIEPVAELDLTDVEALADELARLYRARLAAVRVPNAPTGVVRNSDAVEHSGG